ncbi:MAG TPA: glycosyltransferase family 39 protein [Anaerolineales bacterium]|nr:glycosyltransferase family 39 protein [Anaerolineales bacterium]
MRRLPRLLPVSLALIGLSLVPRSIGINLFATVDEPYWLTAGSDFYYALGQREFASTVYDYHPAVTTMWIVAAAMLLYFPQYRGFGQGYFDVYKDSLEQFLLAHERSPLGLLTTARLLQALLITGLLIVLFFLLRRLLDERLALAATLMVALDPFYLGHSRLINHEGIMTLFVLVAILSLMAYVFDDGRFLLLLTSGAAAGLAQLTKSSSIVIVPLAILLLLAGPASSPARDRSRRLARRLRDLGIWLASLVGTYAILWPGMWTEPARMLQEVFGNALSYGLGGTRLSAAVPGATLSFHPSLVDVGLYLQSMAWRTTPVVWVGAILAVLALIGMDPRRRLVLLVLAFTGALFIAMFGIAQGRNSAHYVLTSYAALDIIAAVGYCELVSRWAARLWPAKARLVPALVVSGVVALQAASALPFFPYYYTYFNPLMEASEAGRQNPNFGYGEGLDLAAAYLDAKPGASEATAVAFYGRGPFSYFFRGETEPLKTVYAEAENVPQLQQVLRRSQYLVIYYALQHGRNAPANVMLALEDLTPETTIWLNGIEYVRVYALHELPSDFYDRLWP